MSAATHAEVYRRHDVFPQAASPAVSIVIPIFNEEESIPLLYKQICEALSGLDVEYEIIAVDDGSRDRSFELLRDRAIQDPRLRVVRFRRNFGQTAAFAAGFERARGDVIVTLDADLQNDPADIGKLLETIDQGYDVVSGWRVHRQDFYLRRRLPSQLANSLISLVTGLKLHDYGCSLKAYRADVVRDIRLYGELHRFIPAIASWQGVDVAEIPVKHHARQFGRSKYGLSRTFRVILDLLTVRFLLSYATRPMQVFGKLGLSCFGAGTLIGLYLTYIRLVEQQPIADRPLLLLSILLIVLGVQLLCLGFLGELTSRVYYATHEKRTYTVREELNADPAP